MTESSDLESPSVSDGSEAESSGALSWIFTRRAAVASTGLLCFGLLVASASTGGGVVHSGPSTADLSKQIKKQTVAPLGTSIAHPAECIYNIKNARNGLYLNIEAGKMKKETNVQLYSNPGSRDSQWKLRRVNGTNDTYSVIAVKDTNMALNLAGGGRKGLTNMQIYDNPTSSDSQFKFFAVTNSSFSLIQAANNGMFVCATGDKLESSVKVCVSATEATTQWQLELVTCNEDEAPPGTVQFEVPAPNCTWNIKHAYSGLYLNLEAGKNANEANVQLYGNPNSTDSQWVLVNNASNTSNASFRTVFFTKNSFNTTDKQALNLAGGGHGFSNVQTYNNPTSTDSQWLLYQVGNSTFYLIKSANGPMYLGSNGQKNEANVEVMSAVNSSHVQWTLENLSAC
jgi:hypothetical protein